MTIERFETSVRDCLVKRHRWMLSKANHTVYELKNDLIYMAFTKGRKPSDVANALAEEGLKL